MFITAERIHDGIQWLPDGTVIEVAPDGTILGLHEKNTQNGVQVYSGILCPGFVNAHCHLELSHMKGAIPEHTGLIPFLQTIPVHRNNYSEEQKKTARIHALHDMAANGIVAVGDIANVTDTLDVRELDVMHFRTFVEAIGFVEANVQRSFERSLAVYDAFAAQQQRNKVLTQTIAPHAPYSVSSALFKLIGKHSNDVLSIHNQESTAEDEYYRYKTGGVQDLLHGLGIDDSAFVAPGTSSLSAYLQWLPHNRPYLFVHNTYTTEEDLQLAQNLIAETYWCLCPAANLYIENRLPDVAMLLRSNAAVCMGTDSLASNHQLSIWSELQLLKKNFPELDWETLLRWGTYNGARALQLDGKVGQIAVGKQPGIINIFNDAVTNALDNYYMSNINLLI